MRTLARQLARRPPNPHVNPLIRTWAAPPTLQIAGLRAIWRVNTRNCGFVCEQRTTHGAVMPKSRTTSPKTARFRRFSPRRSTIWALHHPEPRPHRHQSGEMTPSKPPTRRRHAARRLRMAQNPHCHTASRQPGWQTAPNWIGNSNLDRLLRSG